MTDDVFVFGSNLAGKHDAGAALEAVQKWGAVYGVSFGLRGNSFAIPTKDRELKPLPIDVIRAHVDGFLRFAVERPEMTFRLTAIGTGLARHSKRRIAGMFAAAPANVILPEGFKCELEEESHG
jgi:hypothetical protein